DLGLEALEGAAGGGLGLLGQSLPVGALDLDARRGVEIGLLGGGQAQQRGGALARRDGVDGVHGGQRRGRDLGARRRDDDGIEGAGRGDGRRRLDARARGEVHADDLPAAGGRGG